MSVGSVLHVAALPFPTHQGTQAAIRAMLEASTRAGQRAELFTYATEGYPLTPSFPVHRSASWPRVRSLRSGPSLPKLLLDARMGVELRRLCARLRPSVIVAHHVEAAALSLYIRGTPTVFFAHTDLQAELPSYAHARHRRLLGWAGARLDRGLLARVDAVATISPLLREQFASARAGLTAPVYVPTPWPVRGLPSASQRVASRHALGVAADGCVALYAGNLDAYQDTDSLLNALHLCANRGTSISLLLATDSEPTGFLQRAAALGVRCRVSCLGDEALRERVHAAADIAIIPRAAPGGLPIKLLEALARGVPCAISPHAAAGLDIDDCVLRAREPCTHALADSIARLVHDAVLGRTLAIRGREYIAREHSDHAFNNALDRAIATTAHGCISSS